MDTNNTQYDTAQKSNADRPSQLQSQDMLEKFKMQQNIQTQSQSQFKKQPVIEKIEEFDLETITLENLDMPPFTINQQEELFYFLQNGVLKSIEHAKLREKFVRVIGLPIFLKLIPLSFWFVFATKFPGCVECEDPEGMILLMRQKISKKYVKIFASCLAEGGSQNQPQDEIVNLIVYTLGWMVHYLFYKYFPKQRFFFDLRFIIDCYHILIFEFNGVYVSDFYIKFNLERIFTNRFLCYEQLGKPNRKPVNRRPSRFLGNFKLEETPIHSKEGLNLKQQLQDKFKQKKKIQAPTHQYDDLYTETLRENLLEKTAKSGGIYMHQDKDVNSNQHHMKKKNLTKGIDKNQSQDDMQSEIMSDIQSTYKQKNLQDEVKAPYFGSLQLNCTQVSPTIGKVLSYESLQLPYMKKKMIKHVFDTVPDSQSALLNKLKIFNKNRYQTKEAKVDKKYKESLIEQFALRLPPKEYYQKPENLDKIFKDMLDLNYVFQHYRDGLPQLPSSKVVLKNFEANMKLREAKRFRKLQEQKKQAQQQQEEQEEQERQQQQNQQQNMLKTNQKKVKISDKIKMGSKNSRNNSPINSQRDLNDPQNNIHQQIANLNSQSVKLPDISVNQSQYQVLSPKQSLMPESGSVQTGKTINTSQMGLQKMSTMKNNILPDANQQASMSKYHRNISTVILDNNYYNQNIPSDDEEEDSMYTKPSVGSKDNYVYHNKVLKYKEKYSNFGRFANTDININNLKHDLQQKQNLVKNKISNIVHKNK